MTADEDGFRDLAPLFVLDALEPGEARAFADHAEGCADCRRERDAYAAVAGRLGTAVDAIAPPPALRARVLGAAGATRATPRWHLSLAAALCAVLLAGLIGVGARGCQDRRRLGTLRSEQVRWVELLADGGSKVVPLAGQAGAPQASGRLVWNARRREVMVFASGLQPAPPGKRYAVWTIAGGTPLFCGLFDVKSHGMVAARVDWLDETPAARTFAITIEPAAGTEAPTGAMVLAGDGS